MAPRARAALENGADVVLEPPARFACAPAPDFRGRRRVALLAALGVVTHLSSEPSAPCFPPPHRFSNRNLPIFLPPCSGA
ncbi:MAG: nucleotidyltransferase family protein [Oscillospiraceae bacterium]